MWAGWSVLKLFVVGSSLQTVAFMKLFRRPVKMKSCLLPIPVLSTSWHRAQSLWCLCAFHLQAGWEHVYVWETNCLYRGVWGSLTTYSCAAGILAWSHNHTNDYNATRCGHWLLIPTQKAVLQVPGKCRHVLAGLDSFGFLLFIQLTGACWCFIAQLWADHCFFLWKLYRPCLGSSLWSYGDIQIPCCFLEIFCPF